MAVYRLQSSPAVYAPGVIALAQALYREGDTEKAQEIVATWAGLPPVAIKRIAAGTVASRVDEDEAFVVEIESAEG